MTRNLSKYDRKALFTAYVSNFFLIRLSRIRRPWLRKGVFGNMGAIAQPSNFLITLNKIIPNSKDEEEDISFCFNEQCFNQ